MGYSQHDFILLVYVPLKVLLVIFFIFIFVELYEEYHRKTTPHMTIFFGQKYPLLMVNNTPNLSWTTLKGGVLNTDPIFLKKPYFFNFPENGSRSMDVEENMSICLPNSNSMVHALRCCIMGR